MIGRGLLALALLSNCGKDVIIIIQIDKVGFLLHFPYLEVTTERRLRPDMFPPEFSTKDSGASTPWIAAKDGASSPPPPAD